MSLPKVGSLVYRALYYDWKVLGHADPLAKGLESDFNESAEDEEVDRNALSTLSRRNAELALKGLTRRDVNELKSKINLKEDQIK